MDAGKTMKEIDANQVTTIENIADSAKKLGQGKSSKLAYALRW
jgi:hypothetical protein